MQVYSKADMIFTNIDWIFFDVGGVLLDDTEAEHRRTELLLDICSAYEPSLRIEDILRAREEASAKIGSIETGIIASVLRDPAQQLMAGEEAKRRWKEVGYKEYSSLRPEAIGVIEQLSKKYKLGIMANQPEQMTQRLREFGLLVHFHHTGMSGDYGFHKPDPRLFEEIIKETGAVPSRSVMIDDNIERGLAPANTLGMKTIWYKRADEVRESPAFVNAAISSLKDLLHLF